MALPVPHPRRTPTMRWKQSLVATALGVALVAAACGGDNKDTTSATTTAGGATTTAAAGGGASTTSGGSSGSGTTKLSIGETLAPVSLDISQESGAAIPQALLYNVYETLVKIDDQGKFQPLLAKEWKVSPDGLTYTFTLNDNIVFANGDPLTSDTV